MTTLNALTAGIRSTNKSLRMIVLLYLVNFLIALIVAWGFHSVLASALGDSMSLERLMKDFDYTVFSDFMFKEGGRVNALLSQLTWLIGFYFLVNTLLGGGTIAALRNGEEQFSLRTFFEDCGYYFFRFFRLLLIFAAIGGVVAFTLFGLFGIVYGAVTMRAVSEVWPFTLGIIFFFLFLFVVMLVVMMADYAKVATVTDDARSMLKITWKSIKFVFRHFLSTTLLQLSILVILTVAIILYLLVEGEVGMATTMTILLMFLVQQISVGFKIYARVLTFAGELELYHRFVPDKEVTIPVPLPEPVPPPTAAPVQPAVQTPAEKPTRKKSAPRRAPVGKTRTQKKRTIKKVR
jgi:hypothetical protein